MDTLLFSLAIGVSAGSLIYVALDRFTNSLPGRKAIAVASYSIGFAVTWWLYNNPGYLQSIMEEIIAKSIAIVIAALSVALAIWKFRSL